jgi:2-polyprenyl-3-methyl-5-hydroxy-6-metoxy-1,4-benzoquinol methylase
MTPPQTSQDNTATRVKSTQDTAEATRETATALESWLIDPETQMLKAEFAEKRPCPVCGSGKETAMFQRGGFIYVQCNECALLYVSPTVNPNVLQDFYKREPASGITSHDVLEVASRERAIHVYEPRLERIRQTVVRGKLFDVGCGYGVFLEQARESGYVVSGHEANPHAAAHARSCGLMVYDCPLRESGIQDHSIDAITIWDTLERHGNPLDTLSQARRILKPDGWLFATCRNVDGMYGQILGADSFDGFDAPHRLNHYNKENFERLLRESGFRPVRIFSPWGLDLVRLQNYYQTGGGAVAEKSLFLQRILFERSNEMESFRVEFQKLICRYMLSECLMAECVPEA